MPIYKRCSRCGKRIPSGTTCNCYKPRDKDYDRNRRDKKSYAFYHSPEWVKTRQDVLEMDGMDLWAYATQGVLVAANSVHHIIPLKEDWSRRLDPDNLISLSESSHSRIEKAYKTGEKEAIQRQLLDIVRKFRGQGG